MRSGLGPEPALLRPDLDLGLDLERPAEQAGGGIYLLTQLVAVVLFVGAVWVLLDRLGLPANLLNWLGPIIAIASLSVAGVLLRSSRISGFFSAARQVPGPYVGLAMAGLAAALCSAPLTIKMLLIKR